MDNLNSKATTLKYLYGDSPEQLLTAVQAIRMPIRIVSIYAVGSRHVMWLETEANIVKKTKEIKNGSTK